MNKSISALFGVLTICLIFSINQTRAQGEYCIVADPTTTPLYVRSSPNGKVIRSLKNETRVAISKIQSDSKLRQWAEIYLVSDHGPGSDTVGWVYRSFLFCGTKTGYVAADKVTRYLQSSAERMWPTFIERFRKAVADRDRQTLLTLGFIPADFPEFDQNFGRGWKEMDIVLGKGTIQNMFPAESIKYLYINGSPCGRNGGFTFQVENGQWKLANFVIQGCGH